MAEIQRCRVGIDFPAEGAAIAFSDPVMVRVWAAVGRARASARPIRCGVIR